MYVRLVLGMLLCVQPSWGCPGHRPPAPRNDRPSCFPENKCGEHNNTMGNNVPLAAAAPGVSLLVPPTLVCLRGRNWGSCCWLVSTAQL